jgi:DNA-binding response OmpR family regulator
MSTASESLRVLLVDDERAITDYLGPMLERAGFEVTVARDGQAALRLVEELRPALVILDVILPGLDGREVCRRLRAAGDWTAVIMLTQVSSMADKVLSLEEGADDYLCKPFEPQELIARMRAVLRRRQVYPERRPLSMGARLRAGELCLDRRARRVEIAGKFVDLTPRALSLLEYLMLHPDQVFTREQLMDAVWGWVQPVATRAVDMRIAELRRALEGGSEGHAYIETVIGVGYRFLLSVEADEGGSA